MVCRPMFLRWMLMLSVGTMLGCSTVAPQPEMPAEMIPAAKITRRPPPPAPPEPTVEQEEILARAVWISAGLKGRKTASGQIYVPDALTAWSQDIPFGQKVCVRNLRTDAEVLVYINDRGRGGKGVYLGLSESAARKISMLKEGVADVALVLVADKPVQCDGRQVEPGLVATPKTARVKVSLDPVKLAQSAADGGRP